MAIDESVEYAMSTGFERASCELFESAGMLIHTAWSSRAKYASLFLEHSSRQAILQSTSSMASSRPAQIRRETIEGLGIYAFSKDDSAHEAIDGLDSSTWQKAARRVGERFGSTATGRSTSTVQRVSDDRLPVDAPDTISLAEKENFVAQLLDVTASFHEDIEEGRVEYQDATRRTLMINSAGQAIERAGCRLGVKITVKLRGAGGEATGSATRWMGGGFGALVFGQPELLVRKAVSRARHHLESSPLPERTMAVVFAGGGAGLWLHEALGHALECDTSPPSWRARMGSSLPSALPLTVIDAPSPVESAGRMYDDEGVACGSTLLVDEGRLVALLTDRRGAFRFGLPESGNGRCQNYRYPPLPRMRTLSLEAGSAAPDDLIASVSDGVYVSEVEAGRTTAESGEFELHVTGGFRIERGRLTHPVRPFVLRSDTTKVLSQLRGIGADAHRDDSERRCVKAGQVVNVGVQAPSILIENIQVSP